MTIFALVDCNNFYASCERLFQPKLNMQPVVVLSNNDGCVIARSNEAKALGVEMGEPYHLIKERLRGINVFSSNYTLYGDMSARVMFVLQESVPVVEVYSVDEAFLNLDNLPFPDLTAFATELCEKVSKWTGIPVSIGIGATKTLAKIANRTAKKTPNSGGVWDMSDPVECNLVLSRTEVRDIWGVGRQWANWLNSQGIETASQLRDADPKRIRQHMSVVGERIVYELRGHSCLPMTTIPAQRKGLTVSRSFGKYLTHKADVHEALAYYVMRLGEKLREDNLMTGDIHFFMHTSPHSKTQRYYSANTSTTMPFPTNYTPDLMGAAVRLFDRTWRQGLSYVKCGVMALDLYPATERKADLLDNRDIMRQAALMKVMDHVNQKRGARTLRFASVGTAKGNWAMRSEFKSPHYTTEWADILKV